MLTKDDIRGLYVMPPTPAIDGGGHWSAERSVDLESSVDMTEKFIRDGVGGISICGTGGECAALLWEEKLEFVDTVVRTAKKRVPIFAGATGLGTKETIRQVRGLIDVGPDGVFIGLPLWQSPTVQNSVRFFADISEACPDVPVMVYANSRVFKSVFPVEFWLGVYREAPTVITTKMASPTMSRALGELIEKTGDRIAYMPGTGRSAYNAWQVSHSIKSFWSSNAPCGPQPEVALAEAIIADDEARIQEILADIASVGPQRPTEVEGQYGFDEYEAQCKKLAWDVAGYLKAGPSRAPYYREELPQEWVDHITNYASAWREFSKKYAKTTV